MSKLYSGKQQITGKLLTLLNQGTAVNYALKAWWVNKRSTGGLRLTQQGLDAFTAAGLQYWDIDGSGCDLGSSRVQLALDRYMPCPYWIDPTAYKKKPILRVWDSRVVVLVNLHGGLKVYIDTIARGE